MEFSQIISLVGVLILILGFAFKLDAILTVVLAVLVTALVGGLGIVDMLETIGRTFVAQRGLAIFILLMLVIGTLERNGLRESAAKLMAKAKGSSAGLVLGIYGLIRSVFAVFNVSFGGVTGFVRPVVMPMMEGAIEAKGHKINEKHLESLKGMGGGMENIAWFFCQVLFVGGAGGLLVQGTLRDLDIHVELLDLVIISLPVAIFAVLTAIIVYYIRDRRMMAKYYGKPETKDESAASEPAEKDGGE